MHIRREIDNLLDKMIEITANKKESNKNETKLQEIRVQINTKTDNGKRAKGMWTESPEFMSFK